MGRLRKGLNALDVRTKLLLMLGVLSLPLLIVGLYQLHTYRSSLGEQAAAIARADAEAAAAALESWIESHPSQAAEPDKLSPADARELYARAGQVVGASAEGSAARLERRREPRHLGNADFAFGLERRGRRARPGRDGRGALDTTARGRVGADARSVMPDSRVGRGPVH